MLSSRNPWNRSELSDDHFAAYVHDPEGFLLDFLPLTPAAARLVARTLSIDGSERPPEPETYEDPKTPGIPIKAPEHPLQSPW